MNKSNFVLDIAKRGHSKSTFTRNFQFLTPLSPCSSLPVLHVPPQRPFALVSYPLSKNVPQHL